MSRIGKRLIIIPDNVALRIVKKNVVIVEGTQGKLVRQISKFIKIDIVNDKYVSVFALHGSRSLNMQAGTINALINNMIIGVSVGFIKKLNLIGVGYRANIENHHLILFLGYSHSIVYKVPVAVDINLPTQFEIVLTSIDKELIGQVAADIRSYKKPEVYKGKGIRYSNEIVITKEAKKK